MLNSTLRDVNCWLTLAYRKSITLSMLMVDCVNCLFLLC